MKKPKGNSNNSKRNDKYYGNNGEIYGESDTDFDEDYGGNYAMPYSGKKGSAKKKLSPKAKFFVTLFATLGIFLAVGSILLFVYGAAIGTKFDDNVKAVAKAIESNLKGVNSSSNGNPIKALFSELPEHTNFAILGMDDDGTRTDVMIIGTFNSKTEGVTLVSVPRDTYTVMSKDKRDILNDAGLWTPSSGEMKINAVSHYAGKNYAIPFAVKQLEELFGIEIEYYVKIDLDAFRFIVDEIGGVTFDVPQRMYYNDPEQNLHIDLQPGLQLLDGKQAEGLVRYRKADINNPISLGYARADLQRVEVQQDFIKALVNQALAKESIIGNIPALFEAVDKYVETNFTITEVGKYSKFALSFSTENINSYTLPGSTNNSDYYIPDYTAIMQLVSEEFTSTTKPESDNTFKSSNSASSVGLNIQVLNGGYTSGLAAKTREILTNDGFTVASIGDYNGEKQKYTRIIVRQEGIGDDLLQYFSEGKIIVDNTIEKSYDIVIVLGTE